MPLLNVTVGGMRNLGETHIELDGITAIVSENNYGKTNLMTALNLASLYITASPKERLRIMSRTDLVPLVKELQDSDFRFVMELDEPELGEYRYIRYGFSFSWVKDDGSGRKITGETIELKAKKTGKWTNYLKRDEGKYRKSYDTRSFRTVVLDDTQLAVDVLPSFDDVDINPAIRTIKNTAFLLFDALDAREKYSSPPLEFDDGSSPDGGVALNDDDLPRALFRLREADPEKFEDFLSAIHTLFPSFEAFDVDMYTLRPEIREKLMEAIGAMGDDSDDDDSDEIPFRIRDDQYRIQVKDAHLNQAVDIRRMSAGTKRIVWLVANAILAGISRIDLVGIEELETSIHPQLIQELLETLEESRGETRLLISSHSPALIQYLKPEQIYVGIPNEEGVAVFRRIAPKLMDGLVVRAYETGLGFGEYLFELMSSENRGARILSRYLEG